MGKGHLLFCIQAVVTALAPTVGQSLSHNLLSDREHQAQICPPVLLFKSPDLPEPLPEPACRPDKTGLLPHDAPQQPPGLLRSVFRQGPRLPVARTGDRGRLGSILASPPAEDEPFEERGRGEAVVAMQPGARYLARCPKTLQVCTTVEVRRNAAAGVVGRRNHGYGFASYVYTL